MSEIKTVDLVLPADMDRIVGMLFAEMERANEAVKNEVRSMAVEHLDYSGGYGHLNSVGTLVNHLCTAELFFLYRRLKGEADPPARWGRELVYQTEKTLPVLTGLDAATLIDRLDRTRAETRSYLTTLKDSDLDQAVPQPGRPVQYTRRFTLTTWSSHTMTHLGQIRLLQRMQGLRGGE